MLIVRRPAWAIVPVAVLLLREPAAALQTVPYFEPGPCPVAQRDATDVRIECGALVVAQDREDPDGRRLRIAVAVLRANPPSTQTPLVILHGGPSGPGGLRAGSMTLALRWSQSFGRDIVVYDQRGAGFSEPPLCPEVADRAIDVRNEVSELDRERGYAETATACVAELRRNGIDPHFFNSATNAADLTDLRTVLGYERWDVLGVSYGSRLAQEAMRRDPLGIRSAVLVSPVIPTVAKVENPLSLERALERIFAECGAQPACSTTFPSPKQDLYDLHAELSGTPMEVVVVHQDGSSIAVSLDGRRLLADINGRYSTAEIDRLPLLLHELRRGDRAAAARVLVGGGVGTNAINNVLTQLVNCYDLWGSDEYRRVAEQLRPRLSAPFRPFLTDGAVCSFFLDRFGPDAGHALVRSDIPTLILSQQFDDRTPTEHGRQIASALGHAYLFELPGLGHGGTPPGCVDTLVLGFLRDPAREPDASCIAAMPRLVFETARLERPMLFFAIRTSDETAHPFAGTWDAPFPNAPREFDISLTITGSTVSGSITAGDGALDLPIFDGTVDADAITFKVMTPEGGRTVTFTGTVADDRISFVRDVAVPPGANPGGAGLWGELGARTFSARRR